MTRNDTLATPSSRAPLTRPERLKIALLSTWFFSAIGAMWLLKPVRTASMLMHLGATELPYLRFGSVLAVAGVVLVYSRLVNRFSRLDIVRGSSLLFSCVLIAFWLALRLGGEALGGQRWFVWAVFILVDIYSTVMVSIFWTYTNDVVSRPEADRIYGPIGVGGILGGVAGGVVVDALVTSVGPVDMLLVCVALILLGGALGWFAEALLKPPPRSVAAMRPDGSQPRSRRSDALEGAREVLRNRYLLCIVAIVLSYEFAAALTDFAINVAFERNFDSEIEIAQMYGRLGWIVSGVALLSQLFLVPRLLPFKRAALLLSPLVMLGATIGFAAFPVVAMAIALAASDRGLNYSLQQVTKESLYVPLTDVQKYKAKAFIDVFVDRAGKALSSVALLAVIAVRGVSITDALVLALAALVAWIVAANVLGRAYRAVATGSAAMIENAPGAPVDVQPPEVSASRP
jgi:AAA family ATP:ADP antiporter